MLRDTTAFEKRWSKSLGKGQYVDGGTSCSACMYDYLQSVHGSFYLFKLLYFCLSYKVLAIDVRVTRACEQVRQTSKL
jgi:hypothetical protein